MLVQKYKIIEKIKEGSFGSIFKGENSRTKELIAIKFEPKDIDKKTLKNEAKIYHYFGKLDGFPQLKWFGTNETHNYLVIDLLGNSLTETINHYKAFGLKTVLLLGIQIIKRVQVLHEKFLLHRDIKPDNFLFGLGNTTNKLHLIDFGISKRYDFNGIHISESTIHNLIGTPNFVSLNVHNGIEPSRRDDLESCIYIIVYMLFGKLGWFDKHHIDEIYALKSNLHTVTDVPPFIKNMLCYVRCLTFDEIPDYNYIINLMASENKYKDDILFEH
jgi:serine/threonine protein kinase